MFHTRTHKSAPRIYYSSISFMKFRLQWCSFSDTRYYTQCKRIIFHPLSSCDSSFPPAALLPSTECLLVDANVRTPALPTLLFRAECFQATNYDTKCTTSAASASIKRIRREHRNYWGGGGGSEDPPPVRLCKSGVKNAFRVHRKTT